MSAIAMDSMSRRAFFRRSGAIIVGFSLLPAVMAQSQPAALPGSLQNNRMLDGWLRINAEGTVTVFTGKVELGQGILTALAQIAADELDIDYSRVEMISADTSHSPNEGITAGSQSVEQSGTALHYAAAEARDILKCALARQACHPNNLADAIRARLAHLGGVELPEYPRQPLREPPNFDE